MAIILNVVSQSPSIASSSSSCAVLSKPKRYRILDMVVLFGGGAVQHRENKHNICLPFAESSLSLSFPFLLFYSTCILFIVIAFLCGLRVPTIQFSITFQSSVCILREIIMFSSVFLWRLFPTFVSLFFHYEKISLLGSCHSERLDESCTRGGKNLW